VRAPEGAGTTASLERVDRKLRRLRSIEAGYRHLIKRAQDEFRHETVDREKAQKRFEKVRDKYHGKIEKLQPKIKALALRRSELKTSEG